MKKYIVCLLGLCCSLVGLAMPEISSPVKEGNVITGHVIEKGTEAGIPYAAVLIVETGDGTVFKRFVNVCFSLQRYGVG